MGSYSDLLFARPSLIEGIGSTIDLFGTFQEYNQSQTPEEADAKALWNDFKAIGADIQNSYEIITKKNK